MTNEMKPARIVSAGGRDIHGVGDQFVELIVGEVASIRPGAGRIAALARCNRPLARRRQTGQLRSPRVERFRKAVKQQDERPIACAVDQDIKDKARFGLDLA